MFSPSPVILHPQVYGNVTVRRYLSHVMRKTAFCICEIKGADQLRDNRAADQHLCFGRYIDSVLTAFHRSSNVDLIGNHEDSFSHDAAHFNLQM